MNIRYFCVIVGGGGVGRVVQIDLHFDFLLFCEVEMLYNLERI